MPPEGLPTVGRQAAKKSKQIEPLRLCACLPQVGLCESIFCKLSKKESLLQGSREYSLFFSQSRKVAKRNRTNFASLRLCETIFFFTHQERKPAYRR
jgi:hypothetical protein